MGFLSGEATPGAYATTRAQISGASTNFDEDIIYYNRTSTIDTMNDIGLTVTMSGAP